MALRSSRLKSSASLQSRFSQAANQAIAFQDADMADNYSQGLVEPQAYYDYTTKRMGQVGAGTPAYVSWEKKQRNVANDIEELPIKNAVDRGELQPKAYQDWLINNRFKDVLPGTPEYISLQSKVDNLNDEQVRLELKFHNQNYEAQKELDPVGAMQEYQTYLRAAAPRLKNPIDAQYMGQQADLMDISISKAIETQNNNAIAEGKSIAAENTRIGNENKALAKEELENSLAGAKSQVLKDSKMIMEALSSKNPTEWARNTIGSGELSSSVMALDDLMKQKYGENWDTMDTAFMTDGGQIKPFQQINQLLNKVGSISPDGNFNIDFNKINPVDTPEVFKKANGKSGSDNIYENLAAGLAIASGRGTTVTDKFGNKQVVTEDVRMNPDKYYTDKDGNTILMEKADKVLLNGKYVPTKSIDKNDTEGNKYKILKEKEHKRTDGTTFSSYDILRTSDGKVMKGVSDNWLDKFAKEDAKVTQNKIQGVSGKIQNAIMPKANYDKQMAQQDKIKTEAIAKANNITPAQAAAIPPQGKNMSTQKTGINGTLNKPYSGATPIGNLISKGVSVIKNLFSPKPAAVPADPYQKYKDMFKKGQNWGTVANLAKKETGKDWNTIDTSLNKGFWSKAGAFNQYNKTKQEKW